MPLRLVPTAPSANYEADVAELNQLSAGFAQIAGQVAPMAEQYTNASRKLIQARAARRLLDAGVPIQPDAFGLASGTAESAQAAEAEAVDTRDGLRHSLHEVATALNRRMQLALAVGLSDAEKSGADSGSPERVQELVDALNRAADDYEKRHKTMDALAVYDRVVAVTKSAGETPALSQALEAQKKTVNSFIAEPPEDMKIVATRPGLQLAKQQTHLASSEIESLRQNSLRWFVDYRKMVDQLVEFAGVAGETSR
jgi:hypothetical protein